jgi:hypothetical protein
LIDGAWNFLNATTPVCVVVLKIPPRRAGGFSVMMKASLLIGQMLLNCRKALRLFG